MKESKRLINDSIKDNEISIKIRNLINAQRLSSLASINRDYDEVLLRKEKPIKS